MRVGDWLLTPQRVAVHLPTSTAVAADLHLGYDGARRRRGDAVPFLGPEELVRALEPLVSRFGAKRLVVAGDLFEEASGTALVPDLLALLKGLGVELAGVVPGNHDRALLSGKTVLPLFPEGHRLGEWLVVHGDGALPEGRVVLGHFHPILRWSGHLSAPCYLLAEGQIVLPAFSPDAAGGNVLGARRWQRHRAAVIAGDSVLDFGEVAALTKVRSGER